MSSFMKTLIILLSIKGDWRKGNFIVVQQYFDGLLYASAEFLHYALTVLSTLSYN